MRQVTNLSLSIMGCSLSYYDKFSRPIKFYLSYVATSVIYLYILSNSITHVWYAVTTWRRLPTAGPTLRKRLRTAGIGSPFTSVTYRNGCSPITGDATWNKQKLNTISLRHRQAGPSRPGRLIRRTIPVALR